MDRFYALAAHSFAEARPGEIVLYEDAYRNITLAISRGNAAETFGARRVGGRDYAWSGESLGRELRSAGDERRHAVAVALATVSS